MSLNGRIGKPFQKTHLLPSVGMAHDDDDDVSYDYQAEFRRGPDGLVSIETFRTDEPSLRFSAKPRRWDDLKARLLAMSDIHEDVPKEIEREMALPHIFTVKVIPLNGMERKRLGLRPE